MQYIYFFKYAAAVIITKIVTDAGNGDSLRTTRTSCTARAPTCHSLMHMSIPTFASGTRVQTGLFEGSSTILICRKGNILLNDWKKTSASITVSLCFSFRDTHEFMDLGCKKVQSFQQEHVPTWQPATLLLVFQVTRHWLLIPHHFFVNRRSSSSQ